MVQVNLAFVLIILTQLAINASGQAAFNATADRGFIERTLRNTFARPRHNNRVTDSNRARAAIRAHIASVNMTFFEQNLEPLTDDGNLENGRNLAGVLEGTSRGTAGDQIIVVGAHYDTRSQSPGVVDNGSGCSALFDLMRIISRQRQIFRDYTIYFVFFDYAIDVQGGSHHFVEQEIIIRHTIRRRGTFVAFINLDMILMYNTDRRSQNFFPEFDRDNKDVTDRIRNAGARGNFLAMVRRANHDDIVAARVMTAAGKVSRNDLTLTVVDFKRNLPKFGNQLDAGGPNMSDIANNFTYHGDQFRFWYPGGRNGRFGATNTMPSVWLTDTGRQRLPFNSCGTRPPLTCDGTTFIRSQGLTFVTKITELVALSLHEFVLQPPFPTTMIPTTIPTTPQPTSEGTTATAVTGPTMTPTSSGPPGDSTTMSPSTPDNGNSSVSSNPLPNSGNAMFLIASVVGGLILATICLLVVVFIIKKKNPKRPQRRVPQRRERSRALRT